MAMALPLELMELAKRSEDGDASTRASSASSARTQEEARGSLDHKAEASDLVVRTARPSDAFGIQQLHDRDYIGAHRCIYAEDALRQASDTQWEDALGNVDFADVLRGMKAGEKDVRLLVCMDRKKDVLVGYLLGELRSKGSKKKKQSYCELVNIVVREAYRNGCGAGRRLFEAFCADVKDAAPEHAGDLRLYVAEQNIAPLGWYRRLGFRDSGWQSESVAGTEVRFLRMIRKS
eukprot:TRINITY_DN90992_c0_g1_i1.p1 TRINITY_DN90992_c0_g1~~TRINITY_DN90992_c0_g1_i1.p1  ORF type:complete len:234 (-),score=66.90 TRINITY_DN90992_c0_g1_i1:154-855(-)